MATEKSPEYALQVIGIDKFYDRHHVLKNVNFAFFDNAKIGVIGSNGSGKTTLLRILAGEDLEFEGVRIHMQSKTMGYVSQEPSLDAGKTVKDILDEAVAHID